MNISSLYTELRKGLVHGECFPLPNNRGRSASILGDLDLTSEVLDLRLRSLDLNENMPFICFIILDGTNQLPLLCFRGNTGPVAHQLNDARRHQSPAN